MNYLIGGNGYIGHTVNKYFLDNKKETQVVDTNIYSLNGLNEDLIDVDLRNQNDYKKIDFTNSNVILLAGLVGDPITKKYPELSKKINENALLNFIKYIENQNINKLVFISTCSNYGLKFDDELVNEESILDPKSLYAKAKVKIEKYVQETDLDYTILRFATAFGHSKRMRFDLTLNEFVAKLFFEQEIEVYDANTWRPYCHVQDFSRAIHTVIYDQNRNASREIFNIGSNDNNITKKDLVEKIHSKVSKGKYIITDKSSDPRNYKVDFSKAREKLSFETNFSLDFGINEIIQKLKKNEYELSENPKSFLNYGNYFINTDRHQDRLED
jgi:nucleoside-diphosphate-sugar epimerase